MFCPYCKIKLDNRWYSKYYRCEKCFRIMARDQIRDDENDTPAQLIKEVGAHE